MWGVWGRSNLPQKSPIVLSVPKFGGGGGGGGGGGVGGEVICLKRVQ